MFFVADFIYVLSTFPEIDFHMPPICSPLVRPGRPAEAAPVISKQLSDTILRHADYLYAYLFLFFQSSTLFVLTILSL